MAHLVAFLSRTGERRRAVGQLPSRPTRVALGLGLAAALLFAGLASPNLEAQGPQYDELHQAAGAFTWLGAPPPAAFCLDFHGVCVLNTTYSAALKTNLYGLGLRLSGRGFRLRDWRWLGILVISASLLLFALLARTALHPPALAVCLGLMVTDGTLLLLGRYDWGPVALAFALRLAMLGLWLDGESAPRIRPANTFVLAALAGFGAFEKLSSVVVVPALAALLLVSERRRSRPHALAFVAGLLTGLLPLALVNLGWLAEAGELISLRRVGGGFGTAPLELLRNTLALGYGGLAREMILGLAPSRFEPFLETTLLALVGLVAAAAAALWQRGNSSLRCAGGALLGYLAVVFGLCLLPRATWAHHWILATPFQYLAAALAMQGLPAAASPRRGQRVAGILLIGLVGFWFGPRIVGIASIEQALRQGDASPGWDPSLARLGEFAARRTDRALFVAAGWGVGTQIRCFSNGRPGLLEELFWNYRGASQLHELLASSGKPVVYLVRLRTDPSGAALAERIEHDLAGDRDWIAVPVEPETIPWRAVSIRKFQARPR